MGIRLNSAVVYGVQFTQKETRAYEAFMKDKPRYWILMKFIEQQMAQDWKTKQSGKPRQYDCFFIYYFAKLSKKTKTAVHPYKPFWAGMSKKNLDRVGRNIFDEAGNYMKAMGREDSCKSLERDFFMWPALHNEGDPECMFGYVQERNYARDVDYALMDIMDFREKSRIDVIKGTYPWECGTSYDKKQKLWYTLNGQHMVPLNDLPKELKKELYAQIDTQIGGSKREYIAKKKAIWDKYHGRRKPYKCYPCEGWFGSDFYFYSIDMIFKMISEHIPAVKYDVMRLEKFLCFYWS